MENRIAASEEDILTEWLKDLGKVTYNDIEIDIFQTTIDGYTFGLVANKTYEAIDLQPSSTISFQEPWDGEYYT